MTAQSVIQGNQHFTGLISFKNVALPAGTVRDADVHAAAAIATTKLRHRHHQMYAQASATTAAAETRVIHAVHGAVGEITRFTAGLVGPCVGDATVSVDLKVNGSSVLTAAITLNSGHTARQLVNATIDTDALAVGDVLEVTITVNAGTGTLGTGVFAMVVVDEDAS